MDLPTRHRATLSWCARLALYACVLALTLARDAAAQTPAPAADDTLLRQLRAVGTALVGHSHQSACDSRCFALESLRLTGASSTGRLAFELRGAVLADGAVAVPLFGPAGALRVHDVLENDHPATVGFEDGHYYVFTAARQFVIRGAVDLPDDRTLTLVGPVNAVDTELTDGRLLEGARLSGVEDVTVHLEASAGAASRAPPVVMQLSRALRVRRGVEFEYRVVLQAASALGVFRLPLAYGEQVLEVTGSVGWSVANGELVLPTTGTSAEISVTGALPRLGTFAPDPRSTVEWWLLESDAEHRLAVVTPARRFDVRQSPITPSQPAARLHLLARGQQLEVRAETLSPEESLATVVSSHHRAVVWTHDGLLVTDEVLQYENSGLDYLRFAPEGRAVYVSDDGQAQRLMRAPDGPGELLVPLRTGSHAVRVQSLTRAAPGLLGGRLALPASRFPLTASAAEVDLGLPEGVHPVALAGGARTVWFIHKGDFLALGLAVLFACAALRRRARRAVGAVVLGGLWFVSHGLFVAAVALGLGCGAVWLAWRLLRGRARGAAVVAVGALALGALVFGVAPRLRHDAGDAHVDVLGEDRLWQQSMSVRHARYAIERQAVTSRGVFAALGSPEDTAATRGLELTEGVLPVALPMPPFDQAAHASASMVTPAARFRPVLFYLTDAALYALFALWLAALGALAAMHRRALAALAARVRTALRRGEPAPDAPAPEERAPSPS